MCAREKAATPPNRPAEKAQSHQKRKMDDWLGCAVLLGVTGAIKDWQEEKSRSGL